MHDQTTKQLETITLQDDIKDDKIDLIQTLIDNGADIEEVDSHSCTPLIRSIICGNERAAELLIRNGANVDSDTKQNSLIPLHCAVWHRSVTILQMLIRAGVNVDALEYEPDLLGVNQPLHVALHTAAQLGYNDVMNLLLKAGADVNIRDMFGMDALCISAQHGHVECFQTCIKYGATVNTQNESYETPLQIAVERNNFKLAQMCIESGSDMNGRDKYLAHYALDKDRIAMLTLLVKAGIYLNTVDSNGRRLITKCIMEDKKECLQILVDGEADVNCIVDRFGNCPITDVFHVYLVLYFQPCIWSRDLSVIGLKLIMQKRVIDYLNILIKAGARVNQQNDQHQTPLLYYFDLWLGVIDDFNQKIQFKFEDKKNFVYGRPNAIVQYMLHNNYDPDLADHTSSVLLTRVLQL